MQQKIVLDQSHKYIYSLQKKDGGSGRRYYYRPQQADWELGGVQAQACQTDHGQPHQHYEARVSPRITQGIAVCKYFFFHSFTELFQVDSLANFNAFIENATQRKQNLEGYIAAREQVARADEKLAAIKLQDTKKLFMDYDETEAEWMLDE